MSDPGSAAGSPGRGGAGGDLGANPGRFITFEGGEGSGKTTQSRALAEALRGHGVKVVHTHEPGGTPGADAVRALLVSGDVDRWDGHTEALLHFAARRDHLVRLIWPTLAGGAWVVCDRFADSTMAYQGYGMGLGRDAVAQLYRLVVDTFAPDMTVILDLPVAAGLSRAASRPGAVQRYERMEADFHRRLRDGFLDISRREPGRCVVVDADRPIDAVTAEVLGLVSDRFALGLT